jgi:hypothetical protein
MHYLNVVSELCFIRGTFGTPVISGVGCAAFFRSLFVIVPAEHYIATMNADGVINIE